MESPRHILSTFFSDTSFPLVQHHIDSYNTFIDETLPTFFKNSEPIQLKTTDDRKISIYVGGKSGTDLKYSSPLDDNGKPLVPHTCRLEDKTYTIKITGSIAFEYSYPNAPTELKVFENILIGEIPLMLRTSKCYLSGVEGETIGECMYELGGYFIITGGERFLLTQEWLGNNMFYCGFKKPKVAVLASDSREDRESKKKALETDDESLEKATRNDEMEVYMGIRTLSEDGTRGPNSHYMTIPPPNVYSSGPNAGMDRRLAIITLSGFEMPVPLFSIFRSLGVVSDRDVYEFCFADVPEEQREGYDETFRQLILSHETYLEKTGLSDIQILEMSVKRKHKAEVIENIHRRLFSNIPDEDGYRKKAYMLAYMLRTCIDTSLGKIMPSDRDNIQFKRFQTSGVLMQEEFLRNYGEIAASLKLELDKRLQFESGTYSGTRLSQLVVPTNITFFWKGRRMLGMFEKSFKGLWDGKSGISQILTRLSYLSVIHDLRKTQLQIDPSMNTAPPRRLYASQFGLLCPIDSPDGSSVGHTKALTLFSQVSTPTAIGKILDILNDQSNFILIENIHPSSWNTFWTRIFLNGVLVGVCAKETEKMNTNLVSARRSGVLRYQVSLGWSRLENIYTIECGAGRVLRPVYREGTTEEMILACKSWKEIRNHIDYIDAQETDVSMISLTPFHPTLRSEIHMSFSLSANASMTPFSDHNPATRNTFSIAQQKQASSWFNTNYQKRFDVVATMLAQPQRPISQTWMFREMMGRGGCLPYGENTLVAITTYGGMNQEDSVILNEGSLKRGLFHTMYFHSYSYEEEITNYATKAQTSIKNVLTDPMYKDVVKLKEGKKYEHLDSQGIIRVGTIVDANTILVGMVAPKTNPVDGSTLYKDVSVFPKRGHHGRVDAVYKYQKRVPSFRDTDEVHFLMAVKIRLVEERRPVIGDKMASRHSQKGTCGQVMAEADMPFTSRGIRPDVIYNPHGIPTRMTMGQLIESSASKVAVDVGTFVDATPFTTKDRAIDLKNALLSRGFEPQGHEILYNGMTGEQMDVDIFMGPVYYQRLKHMVDDKINYRATGEYTMMTHQPLQGRSDEGGLAIGEMEKDGLVSHGLGKFLHESFMDRSDKTIVQFNKETKTIDGSVDTLEMPYAMKLFAQELRSMHIEVFLDTK